MPVIESDWTQLVKTLGYDSEKEMLQELYVDNQMSISDLAKALGYCSVSVRRRLLIHRIQLRPRGGLNNLGKRKLRDVPDWELMEPTPEVARRYNVNNSTIYAERRLRRLNATSSDRTQTADGFARTEEPTIAYVPCTNSVEGQLVPGVPQATGEGGEEGHS